MSRKELRKRLSAATLAWLTCLTLGGLFILARPTFAQEGTSSVATGAIISALKTASGACPGLTPCPPKGAAEGLETADDKLLKPALQTALLAVLLNVVQFALDRLAYEAAVAIASGGEGQSELFFSDEPGEAWKKFGLDIAGEAIGNLSDVTDAALNIDFDLCAPKDPLILLNLQLGIKQAYKPQKPKCDWNDISSNWEGFVSTTLQSAAHPGETLMAAFAKGLRPGQNELSAAIGINIKVQNQVLQAKTQQFTQQVNSDGFKDLTDVVTGKVETPASVLERQFNDQLQSSKEDGTKFNMDAVVNSPQLIGQMFLQVAGVFTNTLLSTLFNRVYNGLFDPEPTPDPFDVEFISLGGRDEAASRFSNFISANPVTINDYNAVSEFVTCPSGGVAVRNINNCVMDANFAAATTRGSSGAPMTIQEAIDEGLLQGNWSLIPPTDQDKNQDPFCYTYGYCYGNLVKLRKARILPVGWEIAAARNAGGQATLQQIVDGFDDCNDQGTISPGDSSKWCHLIDPNWILKYPDTQCQAYVNGEILISSIAAGRAGECVDTPSCISEDAQGNCTGGYGYCVMEKNVWRFRGDECPAEYAGCLSFTNTFDGDAKSLLLDTVDFSVCTAANAGCEWYRTNKYLDNKGTADPTDDAFVWLPEGEAFFTVAHADDLRFEGSSRASYTYDTDADGTPDGSYSTYSYEDRIYVNNNAEVCSSSEAGCTKMFDAANTTLNLVGNPSFEDDQNADQIPDGWNLSGLSGYKTTGGSYFGTDAVVLSSSATSEMSRENIALSPGSFYTFSFYTKGESGSGTGTAEISFIDEDGNPVDFTGTSFDQGEDCTRTASDAYGISFSGDASSWTRYECTFTALGEPIFGTIQFEESTGSVRVDGIQLERGESAGTFTTGYSASSLAPTYLKIAPDYLGCDGSANDPKECAGYVQMCTAQDVGCNLYTPNDGDPSVPAIASSLDQCPNECVGYATYKQEGTLYDDAEFPLYFIADTATQCSQDQVGCDGFTNLDAAANGGESQEYFTSLRACVKEDQAGGDAATFFTWEGSDASGYQLVTWRFLSSDRTSAVLYTESSGVDDLNPSLAPCANWISVEGADGAVSIECRDNDAAARTALEGDDGCNELSDIYENPDCREFYDSNGNIHYRRVSETVLVDDACRPYRKTTSSASDCSASNGLWDANAGSCFYLGLSSESASCPAAADGCRAYTGGSGRNTSTVLSETFEGGTYASFMRFGNSSVTLSNESVASDGHSLRVTGSGASSGVATLQAYVNPSSRATTCTAEDGCSGTSVPGYDGTCDVENGSSACGTLTKKLVSGQTLSLEFWAKGTGSITVSMVGDGGQGTAYTINSIPLEGGWQMYTLGPVDTTAWGATFAANSILRFSAPNNVTFYLDNIRLKQSGETVTLIKDSWQTPASCDTSPSGANAPQYYLGCEAYRDQTGADGSYYQFSNLCSEKVVGCGAFYDTQNSTSPSGEAYNIRCVYDTDGDVLDGETTTTNTACRMDGREMCTVATGRSYCLFNASTGLPNPLPENIVLGPEAVVVSNDLPVYVVNDGTGSCAAESMGCEEVGLPVYTQDKTAVTSFTPTYLLNLPDTYRDILCDNEALFCEEWSSTQDGNFYFKDPGTKACEFKTNVTLNNVEYSGWFRTGTDEPCDPNFLQGGAEYGIWRNGDAAYDGWAGSCPNSADLCTAFVDPTDTGNGLSPLGTTYIYKDNELLSEDLLQDSQRCNGQISQKEGCALFNSYNNSELTYAASPSYIVSTRADYFFGDAPLSLQNPIDCDADRGRIDPPGAVSEVDVCEMRCKYTLPVGVSLQTGGDVYETGTTVYASACATSNDCSTLTGTNGEDYQGTCEDAVSEAGANARFRNDTNTILKVNRDRECAAWLEPKTEKPTWDPRVSKYVSISSSLQFCTAESCSVTGQDPLILDAIAYANRDISWGGIEYSGYSIPEQLPVIYYDQANINPSRVCADETGRAASKYQRSATGELVECAVSEDCAENFRCENIDEDLRLVHVAGSCDQDALGGLGASCVVGHCEDSGNACSEDRECGQGEDCVVGYCQNISTTFCTSDDQCGGQFPVCDTAQALCVNALTPNTNTCVNVSDCSGAGATCTPAALSKAGSCFNDQCLTDVKGQPFVRESDTDDQCRGFPESTSPFPTAVVETWAELADDGTGKVTAETLPSLVGVPQDAVPQTLKFGFQGVDTCAPADVDNDRDFEISDECLCSYDKASYGNGSTYRYYPQGTPSGNVLTGVCLGGAKAGIECSSDEECGNDNATSAGTCSLLSRKDSIFGWSGYCLEKDTSIQINGSPAPADQACLTWLPVDQLEGSTDLYGKDIAAGYAEGETYYCAEVDTAYVLKTTDVWCAESYGVNGCENIGLGTVADLKAGIRSAGDCAGSIACPDGYFAIMTGCRNYEWMPSDPNTTNSCADQGGALDEDCPFACVPKFSYKTETDNTGDAGDFCFNPVAEGSPFSSFGDDDDVWDVFDQGDIANSKPWTLESSTQIYLINNASFEEVLDYYEDCQANGVTDSLPDWIAPYDEVSDWPVYASGTEGFRGNQRNIYSYAACTSVAQVATASGENSAWTDRLWLNTTSTETFPNIIDLSPKFRFAPTTNIPAFGRAKGIAEKALEVDPSPHLLLMCSENKANGEQETPYADTSLACPTPEYVYAYLDTQEARSYLDVSTSSDGESIDSRFCVEDDCDCRVDTFIEDCNTGTPTCLNNVCVGGGKDGDACQGAGDCQVATRCVNQRCKGGPVNGDSCDDDNDCAPISCIKESGTTFSHGGTEASFAARYYCGAESPPGDSVALEPPSAAISRLRQIFAHMIELYEFKDEYTGIEAFDSSQAPEGSDDTGFSILGWWDEVSSGPTRDAWEVWDYRAEGDVTTNPTPPTVRALGECFGTLCREVREDGLFTVNGVQGGVLSGNRNLPTSVNFFALANENQMPIKNIIVDWGDGDFTIDDKDWPTAGSQAGSTSDDNFYKNHRGLLPTSESQTYCDSSNWGATPRACNGSYISFKSDYSCTPRLVNAMIDTIGEENDRSCVDSNRDGYPDFSPCLGNGSIGSENSCVFRPRVHVKDNWGWCTGVCPGGVDGTAGCFDGSDISGGTESNECNIECPDDGAPCYDADPWVYFDGYVVVTP